MITATVTTLVPATYPPIQGTTPELSIFDNGSAHNSSNSNQVIYVQQDTIDWVIVGCMIGSLVVLIATFLGLILPPLYHWIKRKIPVSAVRIQRRYETIEAWLITKRVRQHDKLCQQALIQLGILDNDDIEEEEEDEIKDDACIITTNLAFGQIRTKTGISNSIGNLKSTNADLQYMGTIKTARSIDTAETTLTVEESDDGAQRNDDIVVIVVADDNDTHKTSKSTSIANQDGSILEYCACTDKINFECLLDDDECMECPICYECMDFSSIVSWSPNRTCEHVFHHECIKEWLLHHDSCPCCRVLFLPIDADARDYDKIMKELDPEYSIDIASKTLEALPLSPSSIDDEEMPTLSQTTIPNNQQNQENHGENRQEQTRKKEWITPKPWTFDQLQSLAKQRSKRSRLTYYCDRHGLITATNTTSVHRNEKKAEVSHGDKSLMKLTAHNVKMQELIGLREKSRLVVTSDPATNDYNNEDEVNNNIFNHSTSSPVDNLTGGEFEEYGTSTNIHQSNFYNDVNEDQGVELSHNSNNTDLRQQ